MTDSIFRPSDFEDLDHGVRLTNATSNATIDFPNKIRILELDNKSIVLRIPARKCAEGHTLLIEIFPKKLVSGTVPLPDLVSVTGKVLAVEASSKTENEVKIELIQFSMSDWEQILQLYNKRQSQIDQILKGSRG